MECICGAGPTACRNPDNGANSPQITDLVHNPAVRPLGSTAGILVLCAHLAAQNAKPLASGALGTPDTGTGVSRLQGGTPAASAFEIPMVRAPGGCRSDDGGFCSPPF